MGERIYMTDFLSSFSLPPTLYYGLRGKGETKTGSQGVKEKQLLL